MGEVSLCSANNIQDIAMGVERAELRFCKVLCLISVKKRG